MIYGEQQHVLSLVRPKQRGSQQGCFSEIEGLPCMVGGQASYFGLLLGFGALAEVDRDYRRLNRWLDPLLPLAVDNPETCAQAFVALDEMIQRVEQSGNVERTAERHFARDVVGAVFGGHQRERQQPLLVKRERDGFQRVTLADGCGGLRLVRFAQNLREQ